MMTAQKRFGCHGSLDLLFRHTNKGGVMCVAAASTACFSQGLISSSVSHDSRVVVLFFFFYLVFFFFFLLSILLFTGKIAQRVKMEKSLNFSPHCRATVLAFGCSVAGSQFNGFCLWARRGKRCYRSPVSDMQ